MSCEVIAWEYKTDAQEAPDMTDWSIAPALFVLDAVPGEPQCLRTDTELPDTRTALDDISRAHDASGRCEIVIKVVAAEANNEDSAAQMLSFFGSVVVAAQDPFLPTSTFVNATVTVLLDVPAANGQTAYAVVQLTVTAPAVDLAAHLALGHALQLTRGQRSVTGARWLELAPEQLVVPATFAGGYAEYARVLRPLVLLEFVHGTLQARLDREIAPQPCTVDHVQRAAGEQTVDVELRMRASVVACCNVKNDGYVVLMKNRASPSFGKVAQIVQKGRGRDAESILHVVGVPVELWCRAVARSTIEIHGISEQEINLVGFTREFEALEMLQRSPLCDKVLAGEPAEIVTPESHKDVDEICEDFGVNPLQAEVIYSVQHTQSGFVLVQGPPGTGKTTTILGIIGAVLKEDPDARVLVCAPSNAAIDEIAVRVKRGVPGVGTVGVVRVGHKDRASVHVHDIIPGAKGNAERAKQDKAEREELQKEKAELLEKRREKLALRTDMCEQLNKVYKGTGEAKAKLKRLEHARKAREESGDTRADTVEERHEMAVLQLRAYNPPTLIRDLLTQKRLLSEDIGKKNQKLSELRQRMDALWKDARQREQASYDELRYQSRVFCSTLSGAAHRFLEPLSALFDTVIIDEAAQCVEPASLVPLQHVGARRVVMFGDPQQLPPTVVSDAAQRLGYARSLFARMFANHPERVHLLRTQFRMHPHISRFPRREFYNDKLVDGEGNQARTVRPWHAAQEVLAPYRFFDLKGSRHAVAKGSRSLYNAVEVDFIFELYRSLQKAIAQAENAAAAEELETEDPYVSSDLDSDSSKNSDSYSSSGAASATMPTLVTVGIISPYKEQVSRLRACFVAKYGSWILRTVDFNTIDGFQGQEKDVIILSCVRGSGGDGSVGFVGDVRRMNVALTRARSSMWIVGNARTLAGSSEAWQRLCEDARERGLLTTV